MSDTKHNAHTPGPWATQGNDVFAIDDDGDDRVICCIGVAWGGRSSEYSVVRRHKNDPKQEAVANAHLIAAAPKLLKALELMAMHHSTSPYIGLAREAISEATGETA